MKKVFLVCGIVALLLIPTAMAYDPQKILQGIAQEFNKLWDAVADLQEQISNITLIPGPPGEDGLNCWDLNENQVCDHAAEDKNEDGVCDAEDCQGEIGPLGPEGPEGPPGPAVTTCAVCACNVHYNNVCDCSQTRIARIVVYSDQYCKVTSDTGECECVEKPFGYHNSCCVCAP